MLLHLDSLQHRTLRAGLPAAHVACRNSFTDEGCRPGSAALCTVFRRGTPCSITIPASARFCFNSTAGRIETLSSQIKLNQDIPRRGRTSRRQVLPANATPHSILRSLRSVAFLTLHHPGRARLKPNQGKSSHSLRPRRSIRVRRYLPLLAMTTVSLLLLDGTESVRRLRSLAPSRSCIPEAHPLAAFTDPPH